MALHKNFPNLPHAILDPTNRCVGESIFASHGTQPASEKTWI
ncbi:MAG: hypothetical protein V7K65_21205 [Nostoc sp.]